MPIPITILTGFLGAGKTTMVNQIIAQNPDKKFGLIINEFGEIGIDGQLVEKSNEEMVEMSNGCLCCVVRDDLLKTVEKMISSGKVDYILIEASGLAEPKPIADTFVVDDLNGKIFLDSVACLIDVENFTKTQADFRLALEQLQFCDFIILNKITNQNTDKLNKIQELIKTANPDSKVFLNTETDKIDTKLIIETGTWTIEKLANYEVEKGDHEHEHKEADEVVFVTKKIFEPQKLDTWLKQDFPKEAIRSKGIMQIKTPDGDKWFIFQMIGASKMITPFESKKTPKNSSLVFIGKNLNKPQIIADLEKVLS